MGKGFSEWTRGQKIIVIGAGAFFGLAALGSVLPEPAQPPKGAAPEFIDMPQPDYFAMIIPEAASPATFEGLAKEQCGDRSFCKVLAWTDKARAARAMPMTEREVDALAFAYTINRANDMEELVWDCRKFPQPDPINCIADLAE